jgi:hypothetical protein
MVSRFFRLFSESPFPVADAAIVDWSFKSFSHSDDRVFVDGTLTDCDVLGDGVTCVRGKVGGGGSSGKDDPAKSVVAGTLGLEIDCSVSPASASFAARAFCA